MKQHEYKSIPTIETEADGSSVRRRAAAIAVGLLASGVNNALAPATANAGPTTPPPANTLTPRPPLPSNWPTSATLGPKDCRWGAPIERQVPLQLGPEVAAMVDTRCEPPQNQRFAYVLSSPDRRTQVVSRVYNGQFVRLDCQIEVEDETVGDPRGSFKNPEWFSITFRDRDRAQQDNYGYVNGANLGQVDVSDPRFNVPPCS